MENKFIQKLRPLGLSASPQKWKDLITNHKGFYDYSEEQWEEIIKRRDKQFLRRLKQLYWSKEE